MAEITLDRAVALLSSERQKDRTDGLADLKHILQQNKKSSKLTTLSDKACHKIFESLFRFVSVDKSYYNRASSKGASSTRLSACASVLRIAVDVFLRNLRTKSIRAIVDHITETLQVPGEGLWEPLNVDYTKCLVTLLHYPPHVEHLSITEWEKLMKFCLRSLGIPEDEDSQLSFRNGSRSTLDSFLGTASRSTSLRASRESRPASSLAIRERNNGGKSVAGEVITCIKQLVASPSAPIQTHAEKILDGLTEFVTSSPSTGNGHQEAFNSINVVATKVLFDQSDLIRECLLELVPVIRRLWNTKLMGLRDELLGTIMLCTVILADAVTRNPTELLSQLIEGIVDTLYLEYTKRPEKELLQIDELVFYSKTFSSQTDRMIIGPKLGNPKAEHNWTLLWAISCLLRLQEDINTRLSTSQVHHEMSIKKQRLNSATGDIIRESFSTYGTRKLCALQITTFLNNKMDIDTKSILLERLIPDILDDNGAVASWTMVVISSLSNSSDARSPTLCKNWQQAWDLASRASTSQTTSRAACNLMDNILLFDLLEYSIMAEKTRSILSSVNLSGPSIITDSSLTVWATITRMNAQVNPGSALSASKQICAWLQQVWTIGTMADRIQTAQVAAFARPLDLLNLLLACTNRKLGLPSVQYRGPIGAIAKYWYFFHSNRELLRYIFHLEKTVESFDPWTPSQKLLLEQSTKQDPNDSVVLEFLQAKADAFLKIWETLSEKSQHITVDVLQILASFCIMATLYIESLPTQFASRAQVLQQRSHALWDNICSFLANHEATFINACLELFSPILDSASCFFDSESVVSRSLRDLMHPIAEILETQRRNQDNLLQLGDEAMDLDDPLSGPNESLLTNDLILRSNRESLPLFLDATTSQRSTTVQLSIFLKGKTDGSQQGHLVVDADLIQYLTQLNEVDILASCSFMPEVYLACSGIERQSLLEILEDLGEKCLQSYELERCESSHVLCIQMMTNFVNSWVHAQGDNLSESAADIYTWLTDVLLGKSKASPKVFMALSDLLGAVLSSNPTYTSDQSSPSPRTSLFTILRDGDIPVKFKAANLIPRLFEQFPLQDHDAIFDDILESLPRDPDWVEGIAFRLYILQQLASQWNTLLRRSIYHMFETPAQVPHSLWYAEKCLKKVAKNLGLDDAKQLFRLFSSQILYTWTETQSLQAMPFSVFGYSNLCDMLNDVQDEIVSQIIMRANSDEASELSSFVNTSFEELLQVSFYKAEAYSIARDISTPPEKGSNIKGAEPRLKKALGTERFVELLEKQFPQIVATFFKVVDQYEQIERAFSKRPNFHDALDILRQITSKSYSNAALPANQQPSFRARYLLDQLDFLCRRSGFEFETIWTPALASFVGRTLIETIHPALGSLHACSVIRKIRILLCIAGPVMLQDYPFEMMLHALRPFLTDIYCSEDSLGIFWYLLEAGKAYLDENPGFMAGIAVSTFVSLKKLLQSSPESKMQESQFSNVSARIREFIDWFCVFLETYSSPFLEEDSEESFRQIIKASQSMVKPAEVSDGTYEHKLLLEILRDQNSGKSLLSKPISDQVVSLLCADFKRLPDYHEAILSNKNDPVASTVAVCQTLQNFNPGIEYQLWAARVIGGSFATTGMISDVLLREQDPLLLDMHGIQTQIKTHCRSKTSIIQALCNMLQNSSHLEAGLVERTLQLVVSNLGEHRDFEDCGQAIPPSLMNALVWNPYYCPSISISTSEATEKPVHWDPSLSCVDWARDIALWLSRTASENPVVGPLNKILNVMPSLAVQILPYILHDILLAEIGEESTVHDVVSNIFQQALHEIDDRTIPHARLVINCILYLRNQPYPQETTIVGRDEWLRIDYNEASQAAFHCRLPKTALLFLEIHASRVVAGARRSSLAKYEPPTDLLHDIFKDIDDPDLYYGIDKKASLNSVMETLEYESSGFKNLLFQSAQFDSELQMSENASRYGVLKALNSTNLQGIANSISSMLGNSADTSTSFDSMLQSATSLRQWDVPVSPLNTSPAATVFRVFQSLNSSTKLAEVSKSIDECLLSTLGLLTSTNRSSMSLRTAMRILGIITEVDDVVNAKSSEDAKEIWTGMKNRNSWLKTTSVHEINEILNCHEALFSSIKEKDYLKSGISLSDSDAQLLEVNVIRRSLEVSRDHGMSQASLKSAMCLSKLAESCTSKGINIEGAAKFDLANVLWDQGEMTASIRMLQQLNGQGDLLKQAVPLSRAELLVTLGHHIAEARLEKPENIIQEYLAPSVKELKGSYEGDESGRVFHGFAMFCDQQLQNPDGLEDFQRVEQIRNRKAREVSTLEDMLKSAQGREREALKMHRVKAKQWLDLDDREYQRLKRSRETFLYQCLENYLLCLKESDTYNSDVLRFCALWLDNSDSSIANRAVAKHLDDVPSRKFAPLMNQLTSRLLDVADDFQSLLSALISRICVEHPFHGMYQIFASSKSKGGKDQSAMSRNRAAGKLVDGLKYNKHIGPTWIAVHNTNINYVRFAADRIDDKLKSGAKVLLRKQVTGFRLEQDAATQKLPPPTMHIDIRANCDYSDVPKLTGYQPEFTVASGVSAPKIVTAIATDGLKYKQLFKGGNDDLRQDAIMEQVFEQVSSLLKDHQATRKRNMGIRTYKVLPLTSNAGIIEFVPNTIPLHDFLLPAHQRYYPKDMKPNACRKNISDVQTRSFEQRVRTYNQVTEQFHPVMRYFFMERYNNPDDWFSKRLAYTRSTAAISILGHVLGLGDRHGHNILLDERTGEVVHIDLGVAFEQGRVLPIPEVVPFRLTRDLVDGMGITKTEGVFRRCCEFTLEALRQYSYSIMTILDVLRYDPLYSWTVSPVRMKKMQDPQEAGDGPPVLPGTSAADQRAENEPSEADRALTVVAKKLSKTLSVTATVNELIQQATDERNLAVLYCGWAAYA